MTLSRYPRNTMLMNFPLSLLWKTKPVWRINAGDIQDLNEPRDFLPILLCELCYNYSCTSAPVQRIVYVGIGPQKVISGMLLFTKVTEFLSQFWMIKSSWENIFVYVLSTEVSFLVTPIQLLKTIRDKSKQVLYRNLHQT